MDTASLMRSLNAHDVCYGPFVSGVTFDEVWDHRIAGQIGETPAWFASLDDLIRMKEAAGRPKDMEDLRVLRELRGS